MPITATRPQSIDLIRSPQAIARRTFGGPSALRQTPLVEQDAPERKAVPVVSMAEPQAAPRLSSFASLSASLAQPRLPRTTPGGPGAPLPRRLPGGGVTSIDRFLASLARIESGGSYSAVNRRSGAAGKYQFMPRVWRDWAGRYLGNPNASMTPENQEFVAQSRITDYFRRYKRWDLVALAWRNGAGFVARYGNRPDLWSRGAKSYVDAVAGTNYSTLYPSSPKRRRQEEVPIRPRGKRERGRRPPTGARPE